ncbi:uncharacterized protein AMSG_06140 [Thecamonas trahens ATCC 50062]|uniref:PARP catalytic domain-containing protein n=1 Tax=Thecamonas trahens ATCC 50062 TaxID=461836 RepID=A0A0L0DCL3_THETB|nr:hypothetical protein AMSG_06140 [Thecamonas trahens ATCC 50062]KNC49851.1 hypothetical protein AMSG_06140 [Thecamonas trahens ATCC 50062]|eukprot:XP_013757338.1 hypothetical protein AMSG_06140 [Thecamonas trahens ATCC 50062]
MLSVYLDAEGVSREQTLVEVNLSPLPSVDDVLDAAEAVMGRRVLVGYVFNRQQPIRAMHTLSFDDAPSRPHLTSADDQISSISLAPRIAWSDTWLIIAPADAHRRARLSPCPVYLILYWICCLVCVVGIDGANGTAALVVVLHPSWELVDPQQVRLQAAGGGGAAQAARFAVEVVRSGTVPLLTASIDVDLELATTLDEFSPGSAWKLFEDQVASALGLDAVVVKAPNGATLRQMEKLQPGLRYAVSRRPVVVDLTAASWSESDSYSDDDRDLFVCRAPRTVTTLRRLCVEMVASDSQRWPEEVLQREFASNERCLQLVQDHRAAFCNDDDVVCVAGPSGGGASCEAAAVFSASSQDALSQFSAGMDELLAPTRATGAVFHVGADSQVDLDAAFARSLWEAEQDLMRKAQEQEAADAAFARQLAAQVAEAEADVAAAAADAELARKIARKERERLVAQEAASLKLARELERDEARRASQETRVANDAAIARELAAELEAAEKERRAREAQRRKQDADARLAARLAVEEAQRAAAAARRGEVVPSAHSFTLDSSMQDLRDTGILAALRSISFPPGSTLEMVIRPELLKRFRQRRRAYEAAYGDARAQPVVAFHGTSQNAAGGITEKGFLMPGTVGARNGAMYGRGIYASPELNFACKYSRGAVLVAVCLLGNAVVIDNKAQVSRKGCISGYDSHVSADMKQYVFFNVSQILPCFVLRSGSNGASFGGSGVVADTPSFLSTATRNSHLSTKRNARASRKRQKRNLPHR